MRHDRTGFADRYKSGRLDHVVKGQLARELRLAEQYRMHQRGDVARRLDLHRHAADRSGARSHRAVGGAVYYRAGGRHLHHYSQHAHRRGRVSVTYTSACFRFHYYGPRHFASYCWYPRWTPWVDWSWHYRCHPLWDPRPIWCRPVVYRPCPVWVRWECPVWVPLPAAASGTWVDVEPLAVGVRSDLQLLAVRLVDPGHPEEKLGPRYRVWFRNNSNEPITQSFNVLLLASGDTSIAAGLPQAGTRVTAVEAQDTQAVDIRLPIEVFRMGLGAEGEEHAFSTLHVLVDANRELAEVQEANNGATLARADILPVDPAAFELEPSVAPAGSEVLLAGEGFGPEPGQVLVHLGGLELEGEILGWYDLGVRLALPGVPLAAATKAELIVIRSDGAAANPIEITVAPPPAPSVKLIPPPAPE